MALVMNLQCLSAIRLVVTYVELPRYSFLPRFRESPSLEHARGMRTRLTEINSASNQRKSANYGNRLYVHFSVVTISARLTNIELTKQN